MTIDAETEKALADEAIIRNLRVLATQLLRTTHYLPVDPCLHGPNMFGSMLAMCFPFLLWRTYAGWRKPGGSYDRAYLAELSVTTIAALASGELAGYAQAHATHARLAWSSGAARQASARAAGLASPAS